MARSHRFAWPVVICLALGTRRWSISAMRLRQGTQAARALTIEDYYRVQSVAGAADLA